MLSFKKSTFFSYVFFLSKKAQKKAFFDILDSKKCFLDPKNEILKNSPWLLSKNRPFSYIFFLSKKSQKETFFDILGRKECLFDLKIEVLTQSKKIDILKTG